MAASSSASSLSSSATIAASSAASASALSCRGNAIDLGRDGHQLRLRLGGRRIRDDLFLIGGWFGILWRHFLRSDGSNRLLLHDGRVGFGFGDRIGNKLVPGLLRSEGRGSRCLRYKPCSLLVRWPRLPLRF